MAVHMKMEERLKNKTIGIVLSGGGIKGMAHVGILKALMEHQIYPDVISGVSAGAIVGALYANGIAPSEMLVIFKETPLLKYNFLTISKAGLFDTKEYIAFFRKYFPVDMFEALEKKLFVVATDLQNGSSKFFSSGSLLKAVLASAALPPVFNPVSINGRLYADGGIMNNFPIEPLKTTTDYIIGSYTSSMKDVGIGVLKNQLELTQRTKLLMLHSNAVNKLQYANLMFMPKELYHLDVLDPKGIYKAYIIGYEHASRILDS